MSEAEQFTAVCAEHGEGPFWDETRGALLIVDMLQGAIVEIDAGGGTRRHELGGVAAAIRARTAGGYVLAVERGFQLLDADLAPTGPVIPAFEDPLLRMNDGGCDPQGRFYCGSMAYDEAPGAGTLWRLDPDRSVHPVLSGVTISNGLQWSADSRSAFYIDTPTRRIDRFAFDPATGAFTDRTPFAEVEEGAGFPDGMAIDEAGGLWVALWGGSAVRHYTADGALADTVELPARDVTACAFGGDDRSTLFITTSRRDRGDADGPAAGAVFRFEAGVRGQVLPAYAG